MFKAVGFVLVFGLLFAPQRASAFDTFWHTAASAGAGTQHGFSPDAVNALQFGTFGPDFFGPLYDSVLGERAEHAHDRFAKFLSDWFDYRAKADNVRKAGIFMHFDNLYGELDRDWKIDYLFRRLLDNTRRTIGKFYSDGRLNEGTKKKLVLLALGASLHMVEDFYSHSDWPHFDFVGMGFPQQKSLWGQDYAPSWFQLVDRIGPPALGVVGETWPIEVRSGVYPPPKSSPPKDAFGVTLDHTLMNHDNSQLFYEGASRIAQHGFGAHPAKDDASATDHQLFAVSSAAMAANEWVDLVEQDASAKKAIDYAKTWNIRAYNSAMLDDLTGGLSSVLLLSCLMSKWDGNHAPKARVLQCAAVLGAPALPTVMNEWWAAWIDNNVLEQLTDGIGDRGGHYTFDKDWYRAHRPADKPPVTVEMTGLGAQLSAPPVSTQQAAGTSGAVTITGPRIGSMTVAPQPAPQTEDQAAKSQSTPPTQKTQTDPDDYQLVYAIPSGFKVIGQRKVGGKTMSCGGQGTQNQANAIVAACQSVTMVVR